MSNAPSENPVCDRELGDQCLAEMATICAIAGLLVPITTLDALRNCATAHASIAPQTPATEQEPVTYKRTHRFTGSVEYSDTPQFDCEFNRKHWLQEPLYASPIPTLEIETLVENAIIADRAFHLNENGDRHAYLENIAKTAKIALLSAQPVAVADVRGRVIEECAQAAENYFQQPDHMIGNPMSDFGKAIATSIRAIQQQAGR